MDGEKVFGPRADARTVLDIIKNREMYLKRLKDEKLVKEMEITELTKAIRFLESTMMTKEEKFVSDTLEELK